jgi:hypothetical protein
MANRNSNVRALVHIFRTGCWMVRSVCGCSAGLQQAHAWRRRAVALRNHHRCEDCERHIFNGRREQGCEFEQIGLIDGFTAPKVRITVRASPTILVWKTDPAKKDRQQVARAPGNGILSVVVAHELIHASGLDNDEHCDDDMFASELEPEGGRRPADDRLRVGKTGRLLPPLWIADDTAARLRDIWS